MMTPLWGFQIVEFAVELAGMTEETQVLRLALLAQDDGFCGSAIWGFELKVLSKGTNWECYLRARTGSAILGCELGAAVLEATRMCPSCRIRIRRLVRLPVP